jgi:hypothetical protein
MISRFLVFAAILAVAVAPLNATGTLIPGLCPTGYALYSSGCGSILPVGSSTVDGNYTYTYTYNNGAGGTGSGSGNAYVLSQDLVAGSIGFGNPTVGWATGPTANWVSVTNSTHPISGANVGSPDINATVNYSIHFSLTGFDLSTVVISGAWTADDLGLGILVNGHSISATALPTGGNPWSQVYSFAFNSSTPGFTSDLHSGVNTLTFSVDQVDNNYDGLIVSSLTGNGILTVNEAGAGVPEPGSILLIATGLGIVALRRRRA